MRKTLLLTLCLCLCCAVPAFAVPIDFTTGWQASDGANGKNYGATLNAADSANYVPAGLTITAVSGLPPTKGVGSITNPLDGVNHTTGAVTTDPGTVFWGKDGDLNSAATTYSGLGVQNAKGGGSLGISALGPDSSEALIFTFTNPVDITTINVQLVGLNPFTGHADLTGNPDVVDFWIGSTRYEFTSPFASDIVTYNLGTVSGLTGNISQFAVEALNVSATDSLNGHFMVGGLDYGAVPIPPTALLLGSGLLGLVGLGWRRRKEG